MTREVLELISIAHTKYRGRDSGLMSRLMNETSDLKQIIPSSRPGGADLSLPFFSFI